MKTMPGLAVPLTPLHLSLQISRALSGKEGAWPTRVGGPPAPGKGHLLVLLTAGVALCRSPLRSGAAQ
jgi:hypothetical protein